MPYLLTLRLQIFFNAPLSGLVTMIFSMPEEIAIAWRNLKFRQVLAGLMPDFLFHFIPRPKGRG